MVIKILDQEPQIGDIVVCCYGYRTSKDLNKYKVLGFGKTGNCIEVAEIRNNQNPTKVDRQLRSIDYVIVTKLINKTN
jgi:hypothetical protein